MLKLPLKLLSYVVKILLLITTTLTMIVALVISYDFYTRKVMEGKVYDEDESDEFPSV